jgi:AraC-like DNA-binding protein
MGMKDGARRDSGRLMLISPQRVFYAGLLGRPRQRISGGFNFYASLQGSLTIVAGGAERTGEVAVLPPYAAHTIASEFPSIICVVVEPETVEPQAMARLVLRLGGSDGAIFAVHVRAAYQYLRQQPRRDGFTTAQFDRLMFGEVVPERRIDRRVRRAAALLNDFSGSKMTAADCAAAVNLSRSRLLHLFKDEIGVPFREFRAWKRARHLLHYVNENLNLAHLAQDMGYPDSTHFSHSIRRFYGLQPRAIFSGSRDLLIYRSREARPLTLGA